MHADEAKIYDITYPMSPHVAGWPGDTDFALDWVMRQTDGSSVNVSRLTCSPHTGTHADAPYHYDSSGITIDKVDLEIFIGPAQLVDVRGRSPIRAQDIDLPTQGKPTRLLLRTGGWADTRKFPDTIPVLGEEVPDYLHEHGIRLVGLDVPSADVLDSKQLPIHHQLGRCGIQILEGLDLREPPPGLYELVALPLKVQGGDGAPVRAILRRPEKGEGSPSSGQTR